MSDPPDDEGSGTVLVLAVVCLVLILTVTTAALLQAAAARHRAQSAADLGALAAAQSVIDGRGDACDQARQVVVANRARMLTCRIEGQDGFVVTQVDLDGLLTHLGPATARAHAGPGRQG